MQDLGGTLHHDRENRPPQILPRREGKILAPHRRGMVSRDGLSRSPTCALNQSRPEQPAAWIRKHW